MTKGQGIKNEGENDKCVYIDIYKEKLIKDGKMTSN